MRIGVIGCGTIAHAVVQGIVQDGHQITVSERSTAYAQSLATAFKTVTIADNQAVLDASDVVFLGLMAEVAMDVLGNLTFRNDQRVITFMAGASLAQVDAMVRPARAVAIMMPFPGIAKGGSPVMMQGSVDLVQQLFGARNTIFPLKDTAEMAAYLSAQAVLSPVARMVNDAAEWVATQGADKDQAERFLRHLVASSLSDMACEPLIDALNTPGGYNQRLRLHMETSGMSQALTAGLTALK